MATMTIVERITSTRTCIDDHSCNLWPRHAVVQKRQNQNRSWSSWVLVVRSFVAGLSSCLAERRCFVRVERNGGVCLRQHVRIGHDARRSCVRRQRVRWKAVRSASLLLAGFMLCYMYHDCSTSAEKHREKKATYHQKWQRGGDEGVGEDGVDFKPIRGANMGEDVSRQFSVEEQEKTEQRLETFYGQDFRCKDAFVLKRRSPLLLDLLAQDSSIRPLQHPDGIWVNATTAQDGTYLPAHLADRLWVDWSSLRRGLRDLETQTRWEVLLGFDLIAPAGGNPENQAGQPVTHQENDEDAAVAEFFADPEQETVTAATTSSAGADESTTQRHSTPARRSIDDAERTRSSSSGVADALSFVRRDEEENRAGKGTRSDREYITASPGHYEEHEHKGGQRHLRTGPPVIQRNSRQQIAQQELEKLVLQRQAKFVNEFLLSSLRVVDLVELVESFVDTCLLGVVTILSIVIDSRLASDDNYGALAYVWRVLDQLLVATHPDILDEQNVAGLGILLRYSIATLKERGQKTKTETSYTQQIQHVYAALLDEQQEQEQQASGRATTSLTVEEGFARWLFQQDAGLVKWFRETIDQEQVFRFADTRGLLDLYDDPMLGQRSLWNLLEELHVTRADQVSTPRRNHGRGPPDMKSHHIHHYSKSEGAFLWWPTTSRRLSRSFQQLMRMSRDKIPNDFGSQNAFHQRADDRLMNSASGTTGGAGDDTIAAIKATGAEGEGNASLVPSPMPTIAQAFKVYVYDVDDPRYYPELPLLARGAHFCKDVQWGFEVRLHHYFLACACRTDDPAEADFYFVPQYTACHTQVGTFNYTVSSQLLSQLVPKLAHFPYSNGRDHVFVFSGGEGADGPLKEWRQFIPEALFIMDEPELWNYFEKWQTQPSFNFAKDILVPPQINIDEVRAQLEANVPELTERQYLGDFVGWNRRLHAALGRAEGPRGVLLRWARENATDYPDLHVGQDVPFSEGIRGQGSSVFCFIPRGISGYTSRFVRALFAGCVPVLLSDLYEVPFWSLFPKFADHPWMIKWPMRLMEGDRLARSLVFRGEQARQESATLGDLLVVIAPGGQEHSDSVWPSKTGGEASNSRAPSTSKMGGDPPKREEPEADTFFSLMQYLRAWNSIPLLQRYVRNAERIRCFYVYLPSKAEALYDVEGFEQACGPRWRTHNAYSAIHSHLYAKKFATKIGLDTYFAADLRTGSVAFLDEELGMQGKRHSRKVAT
ncbi:unnamed protein product [Amoebophrya sp. A120]|nr:unnamed protein product [Amoebophrya sp. A120]|eukprot:GSA120T00015250001.1